MKENRLAEMSMEFSVEIINLVKHLKANKESIISNQIVEATISKYVSVTRTGRSNPRNMIVKHAVSFLYRVA